MKSIKYNDRKEYVLLLLLLLHWHSIINCDDRNDVRCAGPMSCAASTATKHALAHVEASAFDSYRMSHTSPTGVRMDARVTVAAATESHKSLGNK